MKQTVKKLRANDNDRITPAEMTVDFETRQKLAESTITLNGHPATISGINRRFAVIRALNGKAESREWAWETVQRIVELKNGKFVA